MSEKKSGDFDVDRKDADSGMMQMTGGFLRAASDR